MSVAIGVIISILTGLASSVAFWWLQFRVFRTRLVVSETIARYKSSDAIRHQIKIRNESRRDAVDLTVVVRILLGGLVRPGATAVVTLGEWKRPVLAGRDEVQFALRPEHMPDTELRRFARHLPLEMTARARAGDPIDLVEFLNIGEDSVVEVYVFGTDALSGARGYASAFVTIDEVRQGAFARGSFAHDTEGREH